jgi:hypothetical protein
MIKVGFDNSKMNKILESLNTLNYKLEGDEEIIVDLIKKEKYKLKISKASDNFENISKLLFKYIKAKIRMCYNIQKIKFGGKDTSFYGSINIANLLSDCARNEIFKKIMIIIPDRGNDLGIFSKVGLIYESVKSGSMIGYIELAQKLDYKIILLNPYKNVDKYQPEEYIELFWQEIILNKKLANVNNICLISHQHSSINVIKLLSKYEDDFKNRIQRVIFINSGHNSMFEILPLELRFEFERVLLYIM